jgi:glycine/D-amino acid oxidase-like deaminating enzyme
MKNTYWLKGLQLKEHPALEKNLQTEVCIIGAGITGVVTAYLLAKEGKRVVLIEKDKIGSDATHRTTAIMTEVIDTDPTDLIKIYGEEKSKKIYGSHRRAIDHAEEIIAIEKIDCDFMRCSNFIYINEEKHIKDLESEFEMIKKLEPQCRLSRQPHEGYKNFGYIEVPHQAKFHPMKYITALLEKAIAMGVEYYEKTEACELVRGNDLTHSSDLKRSSGPRAINVVTKNGAIINADWVIASTHEPFGQPAGLFFKKGMYVTYMFEMKIDQKNSLGRIVEGTYEDMENPYHYWRVDSTHSGAKNDTYIMLIGGEDHRADIPIDEHRNYNALNEYVHNLLPGAAIKTVGKWHGPILEPLDGLAMIGPYKEPNILYAFGFSGNGMTYSHIAASIFKDTVTGQASDMYELYKTSRSISAKSVVEKAKDYGGELIFGAAKNMFKNK